MQEPSVFTRIINGEIAAYKIYEDDQVIAFLDAHPLTEGHTLVVPRKQIDHIWDLDDADYEYLWNISKKIGQHIREIIKSPRVGVVVEGFGVPHTHVHLVPIYQEYDLQSTDHLNPSDDDLAKMASRLRM